ncbi:ABC transporter substrate-binding protein [Humitalea sp. 24SJ18S-53]|uniref:ABC transporter substrate-binding protein n=1 Tax=Humitalea sp. 24SJ18S-53 TaxID=3422307 RepID=UPI003D668BAB
MTTLRLLFNHEHTSLAPNTYEADSSAATVILKLACPSLVRFDHEMVLRPDLALSWEVSADHRVYTFELRPGLKFHNGRVLDAEAVAACFRRMMDPRVITPQQADYAGLESITATGPTRVTFTFARPCIPFLANLAWRTYVCDDTAVQPVGAGPYEVTAWIAGDHVALKKFVGYHEVDRYAADDIIIRWAPQAAQRIAAIEAGAVDIVETVPQTMAAALAARGLIETLGVNSPRKTVIAFRHSVAPFDDPRMRAAVAHALDRDALRREFLGDRGRRVDGVLPDDDPWSVPLTPLPYDPERARALVVEAGYGEGVRVKVATTAMPPVPGVAARVAEALTAIGIHLDLRSYSDPPWWPSVYLQGDWQMAFQGASARPHPHILFQRDLVTGGAFNPGKYSSAELDAVLTKARETPDAEAGPLYAEAQRIVHRDIAVLPMYASDVLAGVRPGVRGFRPHPLGYIELADVTL